VKHFTEKMKNVFIQMNLNRQSKETKKEEWQKTQSAVIIGGINDLKLKSHITNPVPGHPHPSRWYLWQITFKMQRCVMKNKCPRRRQIPEVAIIVKTQGHDVKIYDSNIKVLSQGTCIWNTKALSLISFKRNSHSKDIANVEVFCKWVKL
jgi:hypothetical protein